MFMHLIVEILGIVCYPVILLPIVEAYAGHSKIMTTLFSSWLAVLLSHFRINTLLAVVTYYIVDTEHDTTFFVFDPVIWIIKLVNLFGEGILLLEA